MYKLMTVDDSDIIKNKIAKTALNSDFEVVAKASDGLEAVHLFQEYRPDIITMDLTMPKMDGLECIRRLKGIDPNVKILVVSALADKATALEALKLGAVGFVVKPFSDEQLSQALAKITQKKNRNR